MMRDKMTGAGFKRRLLLSSFKHIEARAIRHQKGLCRNGAIRLISLANGRLEE
jgi:hypothetical protein